MIDEVSLKADAERCWNSRDSSALRAEFGGEFNRYYAYRRACAGGWVRMFGAEVAEDGSVTPRATVVS